MRLLRRLVPQTGAAGIAGRVPLIYSALLALSCILFFNVVIVALFNAGRFSQPVQIVGNMGLAFSVFIYCLGRLKQLMQAKDRLEAANDEIKKEKLLLSAILESSPEIIAFSLDTNYCYTAFNQMHKNAMKSIWGKVIERGTNMLEVIGDDDDRQRAKENFDRALDGESFGVAEEFGDSNRSRLFWQNYYAPIRSEGAAVIGISCFVLNITMLKKAEEKKVRLSFYDPLTGLYNRRYYEDSLAQMDEETVLSIIVMDVNGLKFTNDIFGHIVGDKLIKALSEILKQVCRKGDIIARIGGDEFVALLPATDAGQLKKIIDRIETAISRQRLEKGILSVSFGWATKRDADEKIEQLFRKADDMMYSQKLMSKNEFDRCLLSQLNATWTATNPAGQAHSKNVSLLCERIGNELSLSPEEIKELKLAGYLHDIGKVVIDKAIILKKGPLDEYEWQEMKRHSECGYKILSHFNKYRAIADYILYHHERPDGTGYPLGLESDQIPLLSKIISAASAYDTLTGEIAYGEKQSAEEAMAELKANAGTQYDAEVVNALETVLRKA